MKSNHLIKIIFLTAVVLLAVVGYQAISARQTRVNDPKFSACAKSFQAQEFDATNPVSGPVSGEEETNAIDDEDSVSLDEIPTEDESGQASGEWKESEMESSSDVGPETESSEEIENTPHEAPKLDGFSKEPFIVLSPHEAVVKSYSELKSALANNNGITTVYFGSDITMQLTGIQINPKKSHVVVSGINPLEPGQTDPYTLTDHSSVSFYDTIHIDLEGVESLIVRDLSITGKNFYGPFGVYDSSLFSGVIITYERVNYNGPQLCYHRKGIVNIIDCTVEIHGRNGGSIKQEFSEAKHLVFKGNNTIDTVTNDYSVFWHPYGGTFKIADDSSLTLTSPDTSDVFGVFYADGASYNIDIVVGRRAAFDMTISNVVASEIYVKLNSLSVQERGAFHLTTTKTATGAILCMEGPLTVEKDAKFIIDAYGGSALYAIHKQQNGDITVGKDATFQITSDHASWCLMNLFGRAFICNDPASILFYNAGRNIRAMTTAGQLDINAQQINYWSTVSISSLDKPPLYKWEKLDKKNFSLKGTLAVGDSGNFTSLASNYEEGDPPGISPSASSFNMVNARVLAFGRLELTVTEPTVQSTAISGVTKPGATVRASFTQQGINYTFPDATADQEGVFHIPLDVTLNNATVITVKSNWRYLTAEATAVVSGEGTLVFFVPASMEFFTTELALHTQTVKRLDPDWGIIVVDTRRTGAGWSIYARLGSEMASDSAMPHVLGGALVFVEASGNTITMDTDTDILIEKSASIGDEEVFPVDWDENKGVLLVIEPLAAFAGMVYSGSISWTLVDGP